MALLGGCARKPKPSAPCVPTCADPTSCLDSCGGKTCACAGGEVCDDHFACVPCSAGSCRFAATACLDECGNADLSCTKSCADPDHCVDDCGVSDSDACAGVECDPDQPGGCRDTCGRYAANCCCVPTTCVTVSACRDDCGNFDPSACRGQMCGVSCLDTCGEPDASCWAVCSDPVDCKDDCGNVNTVACGGQICDPKQPGRDSCGLPDDGC